LNILEKVSLPDEITALLRTLSSVGFFERSALIGSWVMPIYHELYNAHYTSVEKRLGVERTSSRKLAQLFKIEQ
jgi:hypothetical protein